MKRRAEDNIKTISLIKQKRNHPFVNTTHIWQFGKSGAVMYSEEHIFGIQSLYSCLFSLWAIPHLRQAAGRCASA